MRENISVLVRKKPILPVFLVKIIASVIHHITVAFIRNTMSYRENFRKL